MGKKLYLECYSGISGDMMVASLLDLGADKEILIKALNSLPIKNFKINISRVLKNGIDACDFDVILDKNYENHDHDIEYLFGNKDCHAHNKHHHHHNTHPEHRNLKDIISIIEQTDITNNSKEIAVNIFNILGEAEAKAHGTTVDKVHFHEVGAIDSIVDIVSVAVCLDNLNIKEVVVPVLYEGSGFINCQHGLMPIPVPAVSHIISKNNLKLRITDIKGELVTPTGAAIVAAIKTSDKLPKEFTIEKIGLGAGKRAYENPSILRSMIINDCDEEKDFIVKLESNIDDCSGEVLGYTMECLLNAGAKDVNYTPVYMKKNRPAYQLNVICKEEDAAKLEQIIFEQTTTIGIRKQIMERTILKRNIEMKKTSLGDVKVKVCNLSNGKRYYPEYESVIELCKKYNKSYSDVYQIIKNECSEN